MANKIWKNCKADFYYQDGSAAYLQEPGYDVRIDDETIVVSYEDEEGHVVYRGINNGDGHYELSAPERRGTATLHRSPDSDVLEGFWIEDGARGMWAIFLDEAD